MAVPLLDFDTYRVGYQLPRRERTFSRFHRELTTAASPELARLVTAEGMTSSDEWTYRARDSFVNLTNKLKRGLKKIIQRTTGKTFFQVNPTSPLLYENARKSEQFFSSLEMVRIKSDSMVGKIASTSVKTRGRRYC